MKYRQEEDSLGIVNVPIDRLWGAQTERSLENFPQGVELMPKSQIRAIVTVKRAAAIVNHDEGRLDERRKDLIVAACDEILAGGFDEEFPLTVWQTGSGTQTNMNVNEVVANLSNKKAGEKLIHPNDHVNMGQSTNDVFPTAIHLSSLKGLRDLLYPQVEETIKTLKRLEEENKDIIKTGRTHLQDATPVRLSQEISAWRTALVRDLEAIKRNAQDLKTLAIGGTAVGTGLNATRAYPEKMARELSEFYDLDLKSDDNKFFELSTKSALVNTHGAIKTLATDVYKMANDIRFLASGPRSGIGELIIPSNEPGSSIMPGKVNPTQVESITMVAIKVMANDLAISIANSQGQLELNAYMPLMVQAMDNTLVLFSKSLACFREKLLEGVVANKDKLRENLENSLMLVTSLSPHIGYDKAARLAKNAHAKGISLRQSNKDLGYLDDEDFLTYTDPERMV